VAKEENKRQQELRSYKGLMRVGVAVLGAACACALPVPVGLRADRRLCRRMKAAPPCCVTQPFQRGLARVAAGPLAALDPGSPALSPCSLASPPVLLRLT
jgi:hypothetical protein